MPYLIVKIILSLSTAALLGFLVAWWWTRLSERRRSNELEGVWTQKVQRANRELDALRSDLRTEATRSQMLSDSEMELQARLVSTESELSDLREELGQLTAQLADARTVRPQIQVVKDESESKQLKDTISALERELATARAAATEALEANKQQSSAQIAEARKKLSELERLPAQLREKDDALAAARKALSEAQADAAAMKARLAAQDNQKSAHADRDATRIKELEARYQGMLREKDSSLAKLLAQIGELEPLQGRLAEAEKQIARLNEAGRIKELEARYQGMLREKDSSLAKLLAQVGELEPLHGRLADAQKQIARLTQEKTVAAEELEARLLAVAEEKEALAVQLEALQAKKASSPSRAKEKTSNGDDLKKIRGIGPVLEKKLLSLGIASFEQIARWTPEEVDSFQKQYPEVKDRVRRDNWVLSAREEFTRKYGREL